jgi:hypothetical protein
MQRRSLSTPAGQHWRTLGRQPRIVFRNGVYTLAIDYARRKGEKSSMWKRVYSADEWKPGGWATEAAALAARSQFKHWVDHDMHLQQRLAQADSAAARSPASLSAQQRPPDPTRVSSRKQPRNAHAIASLHVIDGKVHDFPLARCRKFARKTRAYRRGYRDGKPNSLADIERLIKVYKSHRSAEVFDKTDESSVMSRLACHVYCIQL